MHHRYPFWISHLFPGLTLILLAFWAGTHPSPVLALFGFLSFFIGGVTLIQEGRKQNQGQEHSPTQHRASNTSES